MMASQKRTYHHELQGVLSLVGSAKTWAFRPDYLWAFMTEA